MAPIIHKTKKRTAGPTSYPAPRSDAFSNTKKDKQAIKHSLLLSKIAKSAPNNKAAKRRRPNKKLVATLESLADALPVDDDDDDAGDENGVREVGQARVRKGGVGKDKGNKSLSSSRGVMKKRAKVEMLEKEMMGRNLAVMSKGAESGSGQTSGVEDRWKALRMHLEANMEKKKEFVS